MKKLIGLFTLCLSIVVVSSCDIGSDEHFSYTMDDQKYHIGDIYCSNGSIVSLNQYINDSLDNGIGVVYATQKTCPSLPYQSLIVYKDLIPATNFHSSVEGDALVGCSTDTTAFDGYNNTIKLTTDSCSGLGAWSWCRSSVSGQHLIIPSVAEMKPLHNKSSWSVVNQSMQAIGGFTFDESLSNSWFWTSTEINIIDSYTYSPLQNMLIPTDKSSSFPSIAVIYGY